MQKLAMLNTLFMVVCPDRESLASDAKKDFNSKKSMGMYEIAQIPLRNILKTIASV